MLSCLVKGTEPPPDIPARYDVDAAVAAAVAAAGISEGEAKGTVIPFPSSQEATAQESIVTTSVKESRRPHWAPDNVTNACMHCGDPFSMFKRRHHCRKCGKCVCSACAPSDNTRPLPEMGYTGPVRLCLKCFCPPSRQAKMTRMNSTN